MRRLRPRGTREDGYVTAELAMALPTLVVLLALGLYVLTAASTQGRCADAAAAGARWLARGDDAASIRDRLTRTLPSGTTVAVGRADPDLVSVRVEVGLPAPAALRGLVSGIRLGSTATAADEAADP